MTTVTKRDRKRRLPIITGPLSRITARRELTPEELEAAHLERSWSLLELACGHHVMRIDNGQLTARCGHCRDEDW